MERMTNHHPLQGFLSGNYTMWQNTYYVFCFAKRWGTIKPAKLQKGDSLETFPSAGLTQQSMTLQVGVDIKTCEKLTPYQNLTQNTF